MSVSRRTFFGMAAAGVAFGGLSRAVAQGAGYVNEVEGYGALKPDPARIFDLPEGFSYRVISEAGQIMDDGLFTPSRMDGMGCFPAGRGRVALVRNHENVARDLARSAFGADGALASRVPADRAFDRADGRPFCGGTSTLVYDLRRRQVVRQHLSLAGTLFNCAGGVTPRHSWLTCEEATQKAGLIGEKDHGWVFEVPSGLRGLADPLPITGMGRFRHEATATDPRTGVVYETEDILDGLIYRYLPNDKDRLLAGGRLQALGFKDGGRDSRNWNGVDWRQGEWRETVWIDLDGVESPDDDLRKRGAAKGAALFARGEGLFYGKGEIYITCTTGGPKRLGQVLRYVPSRFEGRPGEAREPGRVQLFVEPQDPAVMNMADNIAISPWGHLFVCEDKIAGQCGLKAVTPQGKVYTMGRNAMDMLPGEPKNAELAGVCFSPDGSTLFVNIYTPGKTLAITGPWGSLKA